MHVVTTALRENPELAIFLTLAIGFLIGRLRFGTFKLGNVVGTLLAGVVVGQIGDITCRPARQGRLLRPVPVRDGLQGRPAVLPRPRPERPLAGVAHHRPLCRQASVTTVMAAKVMGYDCGTAAGLMAGAFTESTVIGTAGDAIGRLALPDAEKTRLLNNIPVAYAVSYLVGTGFVVWFLSSLAPRAAAGRPRRPKRARSRRWLGGSKANARGAAPPSASGMRRAFPSARQRLAGRDASGEIESVVRSRARVFVERVRRGGMMLRRRAGHRRCSRRRRGRRRPPQRARWRAASPFGDGGRGRASCSTSRWPPLTSSLTTPGSRSVRWRDLRRSTGAAWSCERLVRGGEEIPFNAGHDREPGRPAAGRRAPARRRACGRGARLRRAAVERDRHRVRRPRHPPRRVRAAC